MKTQRPGGGEPRALPSSLKLGETGATWGNLRAGEASVALDERFRFEDDPGGRVFQVTRLFADPLDPSRSVAFYEAVHRDAWPEAPAE